MLQTLRDDINPLALEDEFYSRPFYFSYSSLGKLMYSPRIFYNQYILKLREEKVESHLIEGRVIHALLLDGDKFHEQFVISPDKLPSENSKAIIDQVYSYAVTINAHDLDLKSHEQVIIEILKTVNLHQTLKTDAQRIEKIVTEQNSSYYNYLREKGSKVVIDMETYQKCRDVVNELLDNKVVRDTLMLDSTGETVVYNEHKLQGYLHDRPFGIRGIIDNLVINPTDKKVIINDLKSTGKSISEFKETIEYYNYWVQAAIYYKLTELFGYSIKDGWTIEFNFIVVDKFNQTCIFKVSDETLQTWITRLNDLLDKAEYHYTSRNYLLPYEYRDGIYTL
jgi:hypothetical protein